MNKKSEHKYKPFSWQEQLEKHLLESKANNEDIHWIIAKKGNNDIYTFINNMAKNENVIITSGRGLKMKYDVDSFIYYSSFDPKIILIDATKFSFLNINYKAIAELKKGCFGVWKSTYRKIIMDQPPHIVVFARNKPKSGCLSEFNILVNHLK